MIDFYHATIPPYYFSGDDYIVAGDVQHGPLRMLTADDRAALGLEAVTYGPMPDAQWNWIEEVRNGASITYSATPKSMDMLVALQKQLNSAACASAIYNGFTSSALGTASHYPTQDKDQTNLIGAYSASLAPGLPSTWTVPFKCAQGDITVDANWSYRQHTAAQIQQVYNDGVQAKLAYLLQNDTLAAKLDALPATASIADVRALAFVP